MSRQAAPAAQDIRVAIYTRKSTDKGLERDFNSLDAQREACEQYIKSQKHLGWKLSPTHYDDGGFTGANIDRPAFARLLKDIDDGLVDVVVVYKVDRLSRSLLDFAKVMDRFSAACVAFVSVTQNFSTADAMGRLTLNVLMSFAEFEREMISERTRDKIARSRRRGKWTGGAIPIGYEARDKKLMIVEHEARIVREIFALYLEHHSALEVAHHLNATHRLTKQRVSKGGRLRAGRAWTKDAVLRVLKNPLYAGLMPYQGEVYEGEHEAIVDATTFRMVRGWMKRFGASKACRPKNPAYLLAGRLFCAVCGASMTPKSTTKKRTGTTYRYYQCVTKDKQGRGGCPSRPLPADAIEAYVVERISEVIADGTLADEVHAKMEGALEAKHEALREERAELPGRIAQLATEMRTLIDTLIAVNASARQPLEARIEELGCAQATYARRCAEIDRTLDGLQDLKAYGRWVHGALQSFDTVWALMSPANRLRFVRAIVKTVIVDEPQNTVEVVLNDMGTLARAGEGGAVEAQGSAEASL